MLYKKQNRAIAIFLAVIISVTFLPFSAFHHHDTDEHYIAVASHNIQHSCELDKNFCKGINEFSCGHEKHLSIPVSKCLSCQFHFEKNYFSFYLINCKIFSVESNRYSSFQILKLNKFTELNNNKGPPVFI
ncbi:MAG: hypothetical protein WCO54_12125 [Bacteroidota bacterium]